MAALNFKDFLTSGAVLQIDLNRFELLWGPFQKVNFSAVDKPKSSRFLYRSKFWDFIKTDKNFGQDSVYSASNSRLLDREEFIGLLSAQKAAKPEFVWNSVQETGFKKQFDWSMNLFRTGELQKTVPLILQEAEAHLTEENKTWLLLQLLKNKNFGWTCAFFDSEEGFIGHTPESLVLWNQQNIFAESMALAGTVARSENAKFDILNDSKILQEHLFVVEDMKKKLASFGVEVGQPQALELKHLVHLKTEIRFKVQNVLKVLEGVSALHPTAAMGVFPENFDKLSELSEFELQKERSYFAGPFGFFNNESAQIVVPIRNIMFNSSKVQIFSGCGVTVNSNYESELNELENKRNSVKKMLGLIDE